MKKILFALVFVISLIFASVQVTNYSIYPDTLSPGVNGAVSLVVYNKDSYPYEDIWIVPITSKGIHMWESIEIGKLLGNTYVQVSLPFKIKEETEAGVYSLNFELRYGSKIDTYYIPIIVYDEPTISIDLISSEEKVIMKGSEIKINLRINNFGGDARKVSLVLNSSVFSIKDKSMIFINEIKKNSFVDLNLTLVSNSDVNSPQNLVFNINYLDSLGKSYARTSYITIRVPKFNFDLMNVKIDPEDFIPGDEVKLSFDVLNRGMDVNNLQICVLSNWFTETCKLVGYLSGGSTTNIIFSFLVPENAKSTNATIKLKEGEKEFYYSLPLEIHKKIAKLAISNVKSDLSEKGGTLEIRIENYGNGDAKNVQVNLYMNGERYNAVVGKIPKDDRGTASFYIPQIKSSGLVDFKVEINYYDSEGNHKINENIQIYVTPKQKFDIVPIAIGILLIIIILYFFLKKKK
ncbi:MAG: hypothetical protein QXS37_06720 [Candidatus Aenigmatarchaeota archaeon]